MKDEPTKMESEWMRATVDAQAGDLTRYAASILGDMDAARDVVQDVFLRLWEADPATWEGHLRPWLFRVCRNRALDLRQRGGRMRPLEAAVAENTAAEAPGPEHVTESRDSYARIMHLLRSLPENQREVVRLKFQSGLSYKEIAGVTELTVGHVGVLLHTALQTLRTRVIAAGE
jgi:RNA polymerase sigma-70 factor (ECF subfamily)